MENKHKQTMCSLRLALNSLEQLWTTLKQIENELESKVANDQQTLNFTDESDESLSPSLPKGHYDLYSDSKTSTILDNNKINEIDSIFHPDFPLAFSQIYHIPSADEESDCYPTYMIWDYLSKEFHFKDTTYCPKIFTKRLREMGVKFVRKSNGNNALLKFTGVRLTLGKPYIPCISL